MDKKTPSGNTFLNPESILKRVGLSAGHKVADLGCGGGYFILQAARMVGDNGLAYGVDVLKEVLSSVASKARMFGLSNVKTVWADVEVYGGAKEIKNESIDAVLLIQLFSQTTKHSDIFKEVLRITKAGGVVLVVDWKNCKLGFSPKEEDCPSSVEIKEKASQAGFTFQEEFKAGPYHNGLIFKK